MTDWAETAAKDVAAELFPPPPGGRTREEIWAQADALLPEGDEFDEEYVNPTGARFEEEPQERAVALLTVGRALLKQWQVTVEWGEVVIRRDDQSVSTIRPHGVDPVLPQSEPGGCRDCGRPERGHGLQRTRRAGQHTYIPPTDLQRKARMLARRKRAGK